MGNNLLELSKNEGCDLSEYLKQRPELNPEEELLFGKSLQKH